MKINTHTYAKLQTQFGNIAPYFNSKSCFSLKCFTGMAFTLLPAPPRLLTLFPLIAPERIVSECVTSPCHTKRRKSVWALSLT